MILAEILKLRRQRAALFFGFLMVPLFMTLIAFLLGGMLKPPGAVINEVRLFRSLLRTLSVGGNPVAQLFYALGAAAIFAGEYRYSGWRHLVPRAPRERLMIAKFATFAVFAAISLMLAALGDLLITLILPLIQGLKPVAADMPPGGTGILLASFFVSLLELLALAGLVALVAVVTRSGMAAILIPFLLALSAAASAAYLGNSVHAVPLPAFAADALRQWLSGAAPSPIFPLLALIGWTSLTFGAAIALFRRQDLVSE